MTKNEPHIIEFPKIGDYTKGYISISEKESMPIEVQRIYWTYYTPEEIIRGGHAHYALEQILLAVSGGITVDVETIDGMKFRFILDKPNVGLFIPKLCWRTMQYSHNAVQVCLASEVYNEDDYIRDYDKFQSLQRAWQDGEK